MSVVCRWALESVFTVSARITLLNSDNEYCPEAYSSKIRFTIEAMSGFISIVRSALLFRYPKGGRLGKIPCSAFSRIPFLLLPVGFLCNAGQERGAFLELIWFGLWRQWAALPASPSAAFVFTRCGSLAPSLS